MSNEVAAVLCLALPLSIALAAIYALSYSRGEMFAHLRGVYRRWQYRRYLRSPHWQTMRRKVLRRAGYECERCHRKAPLDVHHLTYARRGHENMSDLQALCRHCHKEAHKGGKVQGRLLPQGRRSWGGRFRLKGIL